MSFRLKPNRSAHSSPREPRKAVPRWLSAADSHQTSVEGLIDIISPIKRKLNLLRISRFVLGDDAPCRATVKQMSVEKAGWRNVVESCATHTVLITECSVLWYDSTTTLTDTHRVVAEDKHRG
ncbi:hypothetical protein EVAR_18378_1 [Eumeta japonica]|uniref:Uncharacterized protein n=1 Tax=Eumeta variegata TaxID=151549 RepID=A0A4C1UTY1_EUMVA|nr:hypothetical protein EVAR_18378_1 [Eumeta japonica]